MKGVVNFFPPLYPLPHLSYLFYLQAAAYKLIKSAIT